MSSAWLTNGSKIVYKNNWISVREDMIINPQGRPGIYGVVDPASQAAMAVPVTREGKFVVCKQFRYTTQCDSWEFPAGQIGSDSALMCARREMIEETGYDSVNLVALPKVAQSTGIASSYMFPFIALNAAKVTNTLAEEGGISEVRECSRNQIASLIDSGELFCPHTIAAFYLALQYIERKD